jgi:hypothetical protein
VRLIRFALIGAEVLVLAGVSSGAVAVWRDGHDMASGHGRPALQRVQGHIVGGLGFGFGPWWAPYSYYTPPAYYIGPLYAVPVPPAQKGASSQAASQHRSPACRQFESRMIVNGQQKLAKGIACPQPDGTWRIVN